MAHARLGEHAEAERLLLRVPKGDQSPGVLTELGRLYALTRRCDEAERVFARLRALDAGAAAASAQLLEQCRAGIERPWRLAVSAGWQHDSNVILEPRKPGPADKSESDQRAIAFVTAGLTPLRSSLALLDLDYAFYGSVHEHLDDYNALYQKFVPSLALTAWEAVRPSLGYRLEYTFFGGESYSRVRAGYAKVLVAEGAHAATEVSGEYRDNTFWNTGLAGTNAERSGHAAGCGLRQSVTAGPLEGHLSLGYDRDRAAAESWSSSAWRAGLRVRARLGGQIVADAGAEYQAWDYREPFPGEREAREDRLRNYLLQLTWNASRRTSLAVSESYTDNGSNLPDFAYTRNIVGAHLTVTF